MEFPPIDIDRQVAPHRCYELWTANIRRLQFYRQHPIDLALPATEFGARLNSARRKTTSPRMKDPTNRIPEIFKSRAICLIDFPVINARAVSGQSSPQSTSPTTRVRITRAAEQSTTGGSILDADFPA